MGMYFKFYRKEPINGTDRMEHHYIASVRDSWDHPLIDVLNDMVDKGTYLDAEDIENWNGHYQGEGRPDRDDLSAMIDAIEEIEGQGDVLDEDHSDTANALYQIREAMNGNGHIFVGYS